MLLYIFAICLVNFYSTSGAPASNASNTSALLSALSKSCESTFLSTQIQSRINGCSSLVPNSEKQFQCMLFYDINRQLCAAVASATLALKEDSTKIEAPQEIVPLCEAARSWTFTDLGEVYKKYVKLVFADVIKCAKVCSADNTDILNVESNYYCKYFKWGSEMLKTKVPDPVSQQQSGSVIVSKPVVLPAYSSLADSKSTVSKPGVPAPVDSSVINTQNIAKSTKDATVASNPPAPIDGSTNVALQQPVVSGASTSEKASSPRVSSVNHIETSVPEQTLNTDTSSVAGKVTDTKTKETSALSGEDLPELHAAGAEPELAKKDEVKDSKDEKKNPKTGDETKADLPNEVMNNQLQVPHDVGDGDDYQDSDDGNGIADTQGGDDGDDPAPLDTDLKPELDQTKNPQKINFQINDSSQKEYYPITEGFSEEDDHFFPFFLTAIIMVVLLYILYHNKSKVSKVIMGLIVEGRQPGRRRNSRGHAYKRLDTLEQAMSANTAAPPSKIIY